MWMMRLYEEYWQKANVPYPERAVHGQFHFWQFLQWA
jgi:hypothetical protein